MNTTLVSLADTTAPRFRARLLDTFPSATWQRVADHVWSITGPSLAAMRALRSAWLPHVAIPIDEEERLAPSHSLRELARVWSRDWPDEAPIQLVALTRGARPLVEVLRAHLPASYPEHADHPEAPIRVVLLHQRAWWRATTCALEMGRPHADMAQIRRDLRAPTHVSRAAMKWHEAMEIFALHGVEVRSPRRWLELGASPGGITAVLATQGEVVAVDVAPLDPCLMGHPGLTFHQVDARDITLMGSFGGLVCDINGDPAIALDALCRAAPFLLQGAPWMLTLKLSQWDLLDTWVDKARDVLADAGLSTIEIRHFVSHRQEVALLGTVS